MGFASPGGVVSEPDLSGSTDDGGHKASGFVHGPSLGSSLPSRDPGSPLFQELCRDPSSRRVRPTSEFDLDKVSPTPAPRWAQTCLRSWDDDARDGLSRSPPRGTIAFIAQGRYCGTRLSSGFFPFDGSSGPGSSEATSSALSDRVLGEGIPIPSLPDA